MNKAIRTIATLSLLLALTLVLSMSAGAEIFQTLNSTLTGGLGTFSLNATVYKDIVGESNVYTYEYALHFDSYGTAADLAEGFKLGNPSMVPIFDMNNTGDFGNFADGVYNNISWQNGFMDVGETVIFSFKSFYRPFESPLTVNCFTIDGGKTATGETIGMAAMIPEPSALAALAMGLLGVVPVIRRRK